MHLVNGRAGPAAKYPPALVRAVLNTIKIQLAKDGELNSVDAFAAGPSPAEPWMSSADRDEDFWDTVNGGYLDTDEV